MKIFLKWFTNNGKEVRKERDGLAEAFETLKNARPPGNAWPGANTDYYTHEAASQQETQEAKWKNFVSSEFGTARQRKQEAWAIVNVDKTRKGMIALGKKVLKLTSEQAEKRKEAEKAAIEAAKNAEPVQATETAATV